MLGPESRTTGILKQAKGRPEKGHAKRWTWKKPCDKPKRNLSAYNFFFQEQRQLIQKEKEQYFAGQASTGESGEIPLGFANLARTVATRWRSLDQRLMHGYKEMAQRDLLRYQAELAMWTKKRAEETKVEEQRIAKETKSDGSPVYTTSEKESTVSIEEQRLSHGQGYNNPDQRHHPVVPDVATVTMSPSTKEYSKANDAHRLIWHVDSNLSRADEASTIVPKPPPTASNFDPYLSASSGFIAKSGNGLNPIQKQHYEASYGNMGAFGHVSRLPRLNVPQESQHFVGYPQFQIRNPYFASQTNANQMDTKPVASTVEMYGFSAPHGYAGVFTSNLSSVNNAFHTSPNSRTLPIPSIRQEPSILKRDDSVTDDVKMSAIQQDSNIGIDRRPRKEATGLELILAAAFDAKDSHDLVAFTSSGNE